MFRVGNTILSEDIATAKFACDVTRCKGACCVVGESGAPIAKGEIAILNKAYRELKAELREDSITTVEEHGLVEGDDSRGYQLQCTDSGECVFVNYDEQGVAVCAIQKAFYRGDFNWEKPVSCHLYPVRLKNIGGLEYANFEYIPDLCSAGCDHGQEQGTYFSDFLKKSLLRRYGRDWCEEFEGVCEQIRGGDQC